MTPIGGQNSAYKYISLTVFFYTTGCLLCKHPKKVQIYIIQTMTNTEAKEDLRSSLKHIGKMFKTIFKKIYNAMLSNITMLAT